MIEDLRAEMIIQFHDRKISGTKWLAGGEAECDSGVWHWIEENHRYNNLLWNEEDKARRTDVDAAEIARCKRLIDRYNQKRNDAVESIDEALLAQLNAHEHGVDARLNSETAGAMIDRLSILSLKIYHMRQQTLRLDVERAHVQSCEAKLARLMEQREDLGACFDRLLAEASEGRAYFKVYRQFKMYNDPSLNPYLYARRA
ncbi:MAG: DUF4254 domain-containing protein [Bacillota bacterium]